MINLFKLLCQISMGVPCTGSVVHIRNMFGRICYSISIWMFFFLLDQMKKITKSVMPVNVRGT
jgi:hypothetical protein